MLLFWYCQMRRRRRSDIIRLRNGGGTGRGKNFKPFLKTRDVPSLGLSHRILGIKTGRIHHFLSNLEKFYFLLLDFSPYVYDIREQFPLPLNYTLDICRRFGLRHPTSGSPPQPVVMTTDFLIDVFRDGIRRIIAHTVKPASKLSARTLEKFEIERIFWLEQGIEWGIIVDLDIPKTLCFNLNWLHSAYFPSSSQQYSDEIKTQVEWLLFELSRSRHFSPYTVLTRMVDERLGLPPGSALWLTRHFLATRLWSVDLTKPLRLDMPLRIERNESGLEPWRLAA